MPKVDFRSYRKTPTPKKVGPVPVRTVRQQEKIVYGVSSAHPHAKRGKVHVISKYEVSQLPSAIEIPIKPETSIDANKLPAPKKVEVTTQKLVEQPKVEQKVTQKPVEPPKVEKTNVKPESK